MWRKHVLAPKTSYFAHNFWFSPWIWMKSLAFIMFWKGDHFAPIKNEFNESKNVFGSPKLGHVFARNFIDLQILKTFLLRDEFFFLICWSLCIEIIILVFKHQNDLIGESRFLGSINWFFMRAKWLPLQNILNASDFI